MNNKNWRLVFSVLLVGLLVFGLMLTGLADSRYCIEWDGEGSTDDPACHLVGEDGRTEEGWLHWVVNQADGDREDAELILSGSGSGEYDPYKIVGGAIHFYTPYFDLFDDEGNLKLDAEACIPDATQGNLILSDYCPGTVATLDVSIELEYFWTAEWDWEIDKSVTPDQWRLFKGDTGTSVWTVEVTKEMINEEYELFGQFCVENTSTSVDAVNVNVTLDLYEDDVEMPGEQQTFSLGNIPVGADPVCEDFSFDIALEEGSTYRVEMTVTLDNGDDYEDEESVTTTRTVEGDDNVQFTDERNPDLNQTLSASETFNYDETFDCEESGDECYTEDGCTYENTARIVGDIVDEDASAEVTVWCYELDVTKDAETSFTRTHDWEIDKSVRTDNEEFVNGTPKIWLDPDASGDEWAYWEVCVTYLGYEDSDWAVSGTISINNPAPMDAVINSVSDVITATGLEDIDADIDFGAITFPYTLAEGDTLYLDYSADLPDTEDRTNTATAVQQNYAYHYEDDPEENGTTSYSGSADVTVPEEPTNEVDKVVEVVDEMLDWAHPLSTNGDVVTLGTLDADDFDEGDEHCFEEYSEFFAWADYPPDPEDPDWEPSWEINNTAKIYGDDEEVALDEASAKLKINWRDEDLTVTKTVDTYFIRDHEWDIDKSVETENDYTVDEDTAKIWLYTDGSGNETATWNVCVTYLGYEDSAQVVSGTITIENTGDDDLDAEIINIVDELAGTVITIYLDADYTQEYIADPDNPVVLEPGDTLTLYYREYGYFEGENEVTVTTNVRDYSAEPVAIDWSDPDVEILDVVNIEDVSDYFGTVPLGTLDAAVLSEGQVVCFDYDHFFAYGVYDGPAVINNIATIVETGQYASAILKINIEEPIYDSAWAKGDPNVPFCEYFSNWGWTNPITPGTYEWPLWAGAAQCDTSNGTLVGSVTVVYDGDGYVTVTYNVEAHITLESTHVYAGYDMFPQQRRGRSTADTVAPGQYYNDGPFDGSQIYVIAHAVVGMPDPDFGPNPTVVNTSFNGPLAESLEDVDTETLAAGDADEPEEETTLLAEEDAESALLSDLEDEEDGKDVPEDEFGEDKSEPVVEGEDEKSTDKTEEVAAPEVFTLELAVAGEGVVDPEEEKLSVEAGDELELTAIPAAGWEFEKWIIQAEGEAESEELEAAITLTIEANMAVKAVFVEEVADLPETEPELEAKEEEPADDPEPDNGETEEPDEPKPEPETDKDPDSAVVKEDEESDPSENQES